MHLFRQWLAPLILMLLIFVIGCTAMHLNDAIMKNDPELVKHVVESNRNTINSIDENGRTPLHIAVQNGNLKIVEILIKNGAYVNAKTPEGDSVLHYAIENFYTRWDDVYFDILKHLVTENAEINAHAQDGDTALHKAIKYSYSREWNQNSLDLVKFLVLKGADINSANNFSKQTPLHLVARSNVLEMTKYLIANNAEINVRDARGNTPLHEAALNGNLEIVRYLTLRGANINLKNKSNDTPLHYAGLNGHVDIIKFLITKNARLNDKNNSGDTPLHMAAKRGSSPSVYYLLSKGAKVNTRNNYNLTPLHLAAGSGNKDTVRLLVTNGADVTAKDKEGKIPLDHAYEMGYADNDKLLSHLRLQNKYAQEVNLVKNEKEKVQNEKNTIDEPMVQSAVHSVPKNIHKFGNYYALVIGINNYKHLPNLKSAISDAKAVSDILINNYGFKVNTLIDATRSDILSALNKYRMKLTTTDNLLIYYAGHGWLDNEADEGYWLPTDAEKLNDIRWVSNSSITSKLKAIKAKHILVVADSCYSGKLARGIHISHRNPDYYERISHKKTRSVISAGGLEPVIDSGGKGIHSVFATAFLKALSENTNIIDATKLFNKIRRPVMLNSDQTPEYSDIRKAGHEGGDFLFVRKK